MNVPAAPIHNWTLPRNSKLIRFYVWVYLDNFLEDNEIDKSLAKLTFCRLFWATVLSPLVMLLIAIIGGIMEALGFVVKHAPHGDPAKKAAYQAALLAKKAAKQTSGPGWPTRLVDAVASFFDKVAAFAQNHPGVGKALTYAWRVPAWTAVVGIPTGALAFAAYNIVTYFHGFLTGLLFGGIGIGGLLGLTVVVVGLATLVEKTPLGRWIIGGTEWLVVDTIGHGIFCRIGRGFKFVGRFLVAGHHAVKYRTCPKVIVG